MSRSLKQLERRQHIYAVDDERGLGNGIIVTLEEPWCFRADPGCGVRGFDTVSETLKECTMINCYKETK